MPGRIALPLDRARRWVDLSAWASIDLRALAVFRVAIGTIAVVDVARRLPRIELFYSNNGLLSNHFGLFLPFTEFTFSLLYAFSRPAEVRVVFLLILGCAVLFTLGYRTRLFHALTLAGVVSIHGRNPIVENGGDVVLTLMLVWALVLPLGNRFSIDAVRASLARTREAGPLELNRRTRFPPHRARSLAVVVMLLQLAAIYFLNAIQKDGPTWREGTALAYTLEQDRMVTWLGAWARDLPFGVTRLLTWGSRALEGLAPMLILSPVAVTACRRIAIVALSALHLGIAALMDVGLFSWVMLACLPLLLTAADFDLASSALARLAGREVFVAYDADCGLCHFLARLVRRADLLARVTWIGRDPQALPPGWDRITFEARRGETLVVWDSSTGKVWTRHLAVARVIAALPFGRLVAWTARIPGVSGLCGWLYDGGAYARDRISAWLGLPPCGLSAGPAGSAPAAARSPARRALHRAGRIGGELAVAFVLVACATQVLVENRFFTERAQFTQPRWARAIVQYGRLFQGWSMFAPDAPTRDGWLVIDAVLADGTHIDPQTGRTPVFDVADHRRLRWDSFWDAYSARIASPRLAPYRGELRRWLLGRHRHLRLPAAQVIVQADVWWIADVSPDPRAPRSPPVETERIRITQFDARPAPDGNRRR
jgi:predicted DCC family thiol-disulfide oxidoreductase YuxK